MRTPIVSISLVAALTIATGVSSQGRTSISPDPTWTAPPAAQAVANPLAARPETAAGGRKIFHQRCAPCHLDAGSGSSKGPDLRTDDVQSQSDGALFWKIASGNARSGMPSFSFLPEPQRWQLVLHIRTLAVAAKTP